MAVLFIKLTNGDDVLSEATVKDNGDVELNNPARLGITHQGVGIGPMNPFVTEKKFTIKADHVLYTATPEAEIVNAYNEKFGTGIVMPPSGLILPH